MMPLVILGSAATRNWNNFVATVSLLLVAWMYSVPPVRLKERPPLDSLANGLGYFLLPLVMGYSLGADPRINARAILSAGTLRMRCACLSNCR